MVTLMQTLGICLSVVITLKAAIQNKFSKSWRLSREYLWWSSFIVKPLSLGFTIILIMILKPTLL